MGQHIALNMYIGLSIQSFTITINKLRKLTVASPALCWLGGGGNWGLSIANTDCSTIRLFFFGLSNKMSIIID